MELLPSVDLILEPSTHNFLPHLLNALDEELLEIVALNLRIRLLRDQLAMHTPVLVDHVLKLANQLIVVGFQRLHVLNDVVFDVLRRHFRLEYVVDESFKFLVACRYLLILAAGCLRGRLRICFGF